MRDDPNNGWETTVSGDSAKLPDETDAVTSDSSPVISQSKREMRGQESEERWKKGKKDPPSDHPSRSLRSRSLVMSLLLQT